MKLQYNKDTFLLDGKPFRILSGAIHYFRVPQAYWEDRLRKLRACGFNTVETYCCWNLHEKQEGSFDFSGMLDVRRFLETAQRVGLYAIVRPGPFICAEIDNGGLPYWLNRYPMRLRCSDPLFLEKTRTYFARLFEELRPMLAEISWPCKSKTNTVATETTRTTCARWPKCTAKTGPSVCFSPRTGQRTSC